jgi:hypothetical protein
MQLDRLVSGVSPAAGLKNGQFDQQKSLRPGAVSYETREMLLLKPRMKLHNSEENYYSIKPTANVGRATVPADIGRHGGRPYVSARPKFLFRLNWPLFRPAAPLV